MKHATQRSLFSQPHSIAYASDNLKYTAMLHKKDRQNLQAVPIGFAVARSHAMLYDRRGYEHPRLCPSRRISVSWQGSCVYNRSGRRQPAFLDAGSGLLEKAAPMEKTAIGGDQVQLGIRLLKITEGMNGDGRARQSIIERERLLWKSALHLPSAAVQFSQQLGSNTK